MSLQQKLDDVEAEMEQIRGDPKYLALKNRNRSQYDRERFTKFTRRLKTLDARKKELEGQIVASGEKPTPRAAPAPAPYVKSKGVWRNQRQKVTRNNQDKVQRNWVRDPTPSTEGNNAHPAIANASKAVEPEPMVEDRNMNRTHGGGTAFVNAFLLGKTEYRKPVKRTPRELDRMKERAARDAELAAKTPKIHSVPRAPNTPMSGIVTVEVQQPARLPGMNKAAVIAAAEPEPEPETPRAKSKPAPVVAAVEAVAVPVGPPVAEVQTVEPDSGADGEGSDEEEFDSQEEFTDEEMFVDSFNADDE